MIPKKFVRKLLWIPGLCLCLYLALLIPGSEPSAPESGELTAFAWKQDHYWSQLEIKFKEARAAGCDALERSIAQGFDHVDSLTARLLTGTFPPDDTLFRRIETGVFELSVMLAACPTRFHEYARLLSEVRSLVKKQSTSWNINSKVARDCIYRLLYGGRTALEEVTLQEEKSSLPQVVTECDELSAAPAASILGVKIRSGDILVSRGGAPTSALIARGNDYPGNFSHVALVHVDDKTGAVSIIESHIERGVTVSGINDYLEDTKLRVMVLRLRSDLPALKADPMLPHWAASQELQRVRSSHVPYDFAMDSKDGSQVFCSEVALEAYERVGIHLWMGLSRISSPGVRSWLAAFGVRHFETQEPSDLEYDPQLKVIAEWRDRETLYEGRLDNAVVEAMLEGAEKGERLKYDWYLLPIARVVKAYCVLLNYFGEIGPIPEGMTVTAALRNKWFTDKHDVIKGRLIVLADEFRKEKGYSPPYWELLELARRARGM